MNFEGSGMDGTVGIGEELAGLLGRVPPVTKDGEAVRDNLVFVGSGTQPGVGVPMVLVSGRLAAERILGKQ